MNLQNVLDTTFSHPADDSSPFLWPAFRNGTAVVPRGTFTLPIYVHDDADGDIPCVDKAAETTRDWLIAREDLFIWPKGLPYDALGKVISEEAALVKLRVPHKNRLKGVIYIGFLVNATEFLPYAGN